MNCLASKPPVAPVGLKEQLVHEEETFLPYDVPSFSSNSQYVTSSFRTKEGESCPSPLCEANCDLERPSIPFPKRGVVRPEKKEK